MAPMGSPMTRMANLILRLTRSLALARLILVSLLLHPPERGRRPRPGPGAAAAAAAGSRGGLRVMVCQVAKKHLYYIQALALRL